MRARFGAEIYDVIRGLDDIQVVFDYNQGVASGHELMKKTQEGGDIIELQAGCRFVEDQERVPAGFFALSEGADELQPLRFPSAQYVDRCAEPQIAEPALSETLQRPN